MGKLDNIKIRRVECVPDRDLQSEKARAFELKRILARIYRRMLKEKQVSSFSEAGQ